MTTSADRGLAPERIAEIIVTLPDGKGRRGTGYRVSAERILTAAHVVDGGTRIRVRFQADRPGEWTTETTVTWRHEGIDIAVLTMESLAAVAPGAADTVEGATPAEAVPLVSYGRIGELDAVLTCTTLGFPRFKLRTDDAGSRFRDAEHVQATCAVLSNRREGTLDLAVGSPPPDDPDPQRSPWEGMSGAPVFTGSRLVGVVAHHHRSDGPGRLAASRVDRWADGLNTEERTTLERLLGRELRYCALPSAAPRENADLVQEIYRAQLTDIAPEQLRDRLTELDDLVAFCAGAETYRWLQAPPWAGKTALAAWFALHPPRGVVPVWFFITNRSASQSDGTAYTEAVIDQLATIAGREPVRAASAPARDGERRLLLREAAERVAERGGTLLLVVDGLDEDQSLKPGGSGTSIVSLLPERPPPNVRVLVTSRTGPGIPADVGGAHPLRNCRVEKLAAAAAAQHTEYEAKYELQQALSGDRLQRDLVGLLTAARGTLTLDDLRELTEEPGYELRRRLSSAFGRILRLRGGTNPGGGGGIDGYGYGYGHSSGVTLYASSRGYLFAHETLLAAAQDELGSDLAAYLERLHTWAEGYERRGWPEGTPPYLLQQYSRLLAHLGDDRRTTALATDARRRERLREVTGSDAACLAETVGARENVRRASPDNLAALAALAVTEDLVARHNESLHPAISEVYARLGHTRKAIGLARSLFSPTDRAWALGRVARVLAETGDRRAVGLVEEGVALTERALAETRRVHDPSLIQAALGQVAPVLALLGRRTESLRGLRELPSPTNDPATRYIVRAHIETALALGDRSTAVELLSQAEEWAGRVSDADVRVRAVGTVADAWERIDQPDRAARLYDLVAELVRSEPHDPVGVSGAAAEVLGRVRPKEAAQLGRLALDLAGRLLRTPENLPEGKEACDAVRALVATGRTDDAMLLAEAVGPWLAERRPWQWPDACFAIAEGLAREGRAEQAWAALADAQEVDFRASFNGRVRTGTRIVDLLIEAGATDQLEALLYAPTQNRPHVRPRTVAAAFATLARHFADRDQTRCLRLLDQAQQARESEDGSAYSTRDERLAVLAGALARAGRTEDAERLAATIGSPDIRAWGYAAVSVALAGKNTRQALRCAERAADVTRVSDTFLVQVNTSTAIVQAWALVGAAERVAEAIEQVPTNQWTDRTRQHALAAEGLWACDPHAAVRLFDPLLAGRERYGAPDLALFLAVALPHDQARGDSVMEHLLGLEQASVPYDFNESALLCLVTATTNRAAARRTLDLLTRFWHRDPFDRQAVMLALAWGALHGLEAARTMVLDIATETERLEALAHLAAYTAGLERDDALLNRPADRFDYLHVALRLAILLHPPQTGPDLPRARALLAEALTQDGWHHAIPVLAALAPEAILPARDVVFADLGLRDGAAAE
ncbi:serine protease [Streptomyces cyaneochromogenes]|uniref:Serine protease n=1 Tax=Streptomyces cyaneochromogenes TaxID=2496836 RepID=A0A3S5HT54_9ACTN|nr:trypsin-like peptidase domain-containing protein [Streptomyces cyaneochromogenes]AZQ32166.1 serine protease [Streptomyces cyaneochromogenes]